LFLLREIETLYKNMIHNYECNFRKWTSTARQLRFCQKTCTLRGLYKVLLYIMWLEALWSTGRLNEIHGCSIRAWYGALIVSQWGKASEYGLTCLVLWGHTHTLTAPLPHKPFTTLFRTQRNTYTNALAALFRARVGDPDQSQISLFRPIRGNLIRTNHR